MNVKQSCVVSIATVVFVLSARCSFGADEEPDFTAVVEALIEIAQDSDSELRHAAFELLARQARTDAIVEAFRGALQDEDTKVRRVAFAGLIKLEGATDEILQLTVSGLTDPATASTARGSLEEIGEPAVPYLLDAMKRDETTIQAIELLGRIKLGGQRATVVAALTALLKDERKELRLEAIRALGSIMDAARRTGQIEERYLKYYEQRLKEYDKNADGSLTENEWANMPRNPQPADVNRDGRVTVQEYARWALPR